MSFSNPYNRNKKSSGSGESVDNGLYIKEGGHLHK